MPRDERFEEDVLYFAYGSNLDPVRKVGRTGPIREARVARLDGHRLAFNKRGQQGGVYANIVPQAGSVVWGVVYRCRPETLETLDDHEGVVGGHYERVPIEVDVHGERVRALAYVAGVRHTCPEGRPDDEYLRHILDGGRHHGLPEDYLREVEERAGRSGM